MKRLLAIGMILVLTGAVTHAQDPYIKLLRSDVKAKKGAIITGVMEFTDAVGRDTGDQCPRDEHGYDDPA